MDKVTNKSIRTKNRGIKAFSISIFIIFSLLLLPGATFLYFSSNYDIDPELMQEISLNVENDILDLQSGPWKTPSFQNDEFVFEIETYGKSNPYWNNVTYSVNYYQMGTTDWFKENSTQWGEWGYAFHHLRNGAIDGSGVAHYGGYPFNPKTKQEAYEYMKNYVINFTQNLNNDTRPWISFNGHYPYHHYAAEFGFDKIGTEIGENMESYQMLMAFNRGAARQYNLPWFVDVSAWYGPGITDYNDPPLWNNYSGKDKGHSLSLYNRSYYMAYMAGASRLIAEGASGNYFYLHEPLDNSGLLGLTPLGELGRNFAHFVKAHPNRGIPYNPIAIYLDQFHGTTGFASRTIFNPPKSFNSIPYNQGDYMTFNLLDELFPGGWSNNYEKGQLVNNEIGDVFDVILQNASENVLKSYPIIVMSGDISLNEIEINRLINYVKDGGTLVVNSAYFGQFNDYFKNLECKTRFNLGFGEKIKIIHPDEEILNNAKYVLKDKNPDNNNFNGSFILYGSDYDYKRLKNIIKALIPHYNPFEISVFNSEFNDLSFKKSNIEFLINRNENGWIITLINNEGITKSYSEPPTIDNRYQKTVEITLNSDFIMKQMNHTNTPLLDENTDSKSCKLVKVMNWITNETLYDINNNSYASDCNNGELNTLLLENGEFPKFCFKIDPGQFTILEFSLT